MWNASFLDTLKHSNIMVFFIVVMTMVFGSLILLYPFILFTALLTYAVRLYIITTNAVLPYDVRPNFTTVVLIVNMSITVISLDTLLLKSINSHSVKKKSEKNKKLRSVNAYAPGGS